MSKVLSVVIPGYNIEKFIHKCLDSFIDDAIAQDIEVILVNDGSKDDTSRIAHAYAEKNPDIFVVIDKENGGHGSVINTAIECARGKYFKVVDGDDWVITENFVELVGKLKTAEVDLVCSGFNFVTDKTWQERPMLFSGMEYDKEYRFEEMPPNQPILLHSITIKTSLLRDNRIRVSEKRFYDDMEYVLYPLQYVKTVMVTEKCIYMYRMGTEGQSVSFKGMQRHIQDHEDIIINLIGYINRIKAQKICQPKLDYISMRVSGMVSDHLEASILFPVSDRVRRRKTVEFDKYIKKNAPEIYVATTGKAVKLMRKCNYKFYCICQLVFKAAVKYNDFKRGAVR